MGDEWLTYAEAAAIIGCLPTSVPKLIRKGYLHTRHQITGRKARSGTLRRSEVERLAAFRREAEFDRAARAAARDARTAPPDDEHEWISISDAARQLSRTEKAVLARIQRDRLPATRVGRR